MTHPDTGDWVSEYELLVSTALEREAGLQQEVDDLLGDNELFAAGVATYEQSELAAMIGDSAAARNMTEFALLLIQKDLGTVGLMLDMIREDLPYEPHESILDAKAKLLADMDEFPLWPPVASVRQLALAYFGSTPEYGVSAQRRFAQTSTVNGDLLPGRSYLLCQSLRECTIENPDLKPIKLVLSTTRAFDKRKLLPGYDPKSEGQPTEVLEIIDPNNYCGSQITKLQISQGSEMQTLKAAEQLLRLPDEPTYL